VQREKPPASRKPGVIGRFNIVVRVHLTIRLDSFARLLALHSATLRYALGAGETPAVPVQDARYHVPDEMLQRHELPYNDRRRFAAAPLDSVFARLKNGYSNR